MKIIRRESFGEDEESEWDQKQLIPLEELGSTTLVEVFSVSIKDIVGDLYGTITLTGGMAGTQYLYNRKREESESIGPDNTALLIGPARPIFGYDTFHFDVDLMDKDIDLPLVNRGLLVWNSFTRNVFDEPIYDHVFGDYGCGSVTVCYIVLSKAVEATLEVTLIIGDGQDHPAAHVYGLISAGNSNYSEESVLFRKGSNEHIDVRSGQLIPLSRSVVAVPVKSVLVVRADLLDYDAISSVVIAKGTAEFPAKFSGTFEERICGQSSEIRVKVTWNSR